jgi:hypothetical protein
MNKYCVLIAAAVVTAGFVGCDRKKEGEPMDMKDGSSGSMNQPSTDSTTTYTCTMHPEVAQTQPGKCLKCGMALTPKK